MKRLKIVATLAACVMSLGLVAGCSQSTSSDTASEAGASESSVEQTEAASGRMSRHRKRLLPQTTWLRSLCVR